MNERLNDNYLDFIIKKVSPRKKYIPVQQEKFYTDLSYDNTFLGYKLGEKARPPKELMESRKKLSFFQSLLE